jgi:hypothetical protein
MEDNKKFLVEVKFADDEIELYDGFTKEQAKDIYSKQKERMSFDSDILSVELKETL